MNAVERAHVQAMRVEFPQVAQFLQETLGQRIVAVVAGLKDPKTIGRYARGEQPRKPEVEARIRDLYQVAQLLLERDSDRTVRAWIISSNPQLDDESPLERMHAGDFKSVFEAARAFAIGG